MCALLIAATMFQVLHVIEACCAFLKDQLDPTNAIGIANFAEQHGCMTLKQQANQFIERHFTQVRYISKKQSRWICQSIFSKSEIFFSMWLSKGI